MTKKIKIYWTNEERASVVRQMGYLLKTMPVRYSKKELVISACAVLPGARRRSVFTAKEVNDMNANARLLSVVAIEKTAAGPVPSTVVTPAVVDTLSSTLDRLVAQLATELVSRVMSEVQKQISAATVNVPVLPKIDTKLARENAQYRSELSAGALAPKTPLRPGVLVVGLLSAQVKEVLAAYGSRLDISHMTGEEANTRPPLLRAYTVLMTKFISHSVQGKYRKAPDLRFCNGGLTELSAVLENIIQFKGEAK